MIFAALLFVHCQAAVCGAQPPERQPPGSASIHLQVPEGTPLRVYIAKRVWFRASTPVAATLIEPLWSFDRVVVPAGSTVRGSIAKLVSVPKLLRAGAILNGDFTPLKRAEVRFTEITFPDGRTMTIDTEPSLGLATIYVPKHQSTKRGTKTDHPGRESVRSRIERRARSEISARTEPVMEVVRGKNKKEWLEEFLLSKLPYHPQWYRARTRFDAELKGPLEFGTAGVPQKTLAALGTLAPLDSVAQLRLLSPLTSVDAHTGDSVEAILSEPVYSSHQGLLYPEGTHFSGKVTMSQGARYFHRGGKIRFIFDHANIPQLERLQPESSRNYAQAVQGQLTAIEANPNALKVDGEGTARATESKTRILRPVLAGLIAANAADPGGETRPGIAAPANEAGNVGGRALGGFSGLGLVGTALSFGPRPIGAVLGYYGLAWSVYTNVIARGSETIFQKNTAMQIRFGKAGGSR